MKIRELALYTGTALSLLTTSMMASAAKVELEVASWKGAGAEVSNFPTIIKKFESQYPDIKVKLNYMARNDMVTVIPARFQAGTPPDVLMVDREFISHWAGNGQLMEIGDQDFVQRIKPDLHPYLGLGKDVYYSMLQVSGMGVFVNDDLFAKAGITQYPETISEFTAACKKLNDHNITPTLLAANNGGWTPYVFFLALGLTDGDVPDPGRIEKLATGKIKFSDDQSMKNAFEAFRQMIDAKCFNPKISAGTDPWSVALTTFQSGRVAMLPQGMWNVTPFLKDELPENFSFHPYPSINGKNGVAMDYIGPGWSIPKDAKNVDAAKKWIDFWSQDENLKIYLESDISLSTLQDGTSSLSQLPLAENYVDARNKLHFVTFPIGSIPNDLVDHMLISITAFMLDSKQDYNKILASWDKVIEKVLAKQ
ncbi:carbohydrate ABC transporter substrate-binding protein [Marinomonas agarivorans]|nr:carbohydrate ABC transporter substrate-binding protein [Marinomonas agarivorans]